MSPLAHVGGVPIEETALLLAGSGTSLLAARAWLAVRFREGRYGNRERKLR